MAERGFRRTRKKLDLGSYTLVTLTRRGKKFQVLVDPWAAVRFKRGEPVSLDEVVVIDKVFRDIQKGVEASRQELEQLVLEAARVKLEAKKKAPVSQEEIERLRRQIEELEEEQLKRYAIQWILEEGELKLPDEVREKLLQEKINKIVDFLSKFGVNPSTDAPYPRQKLEEVIRKVLAGVKVGDKKVHVAIDPLAKDVRPIIPKVVDAIRALLPLKVEAIEAHVWVPAKYTGKVYGLLSQYGEIKKADWQPDGSLDAIVEVPAGLVLRLTEALRKATGGSFRLDILARRTIA